MTWDVVIQLVVGLGGVASLVGLLKVRADKRRILAEAGKVGADASAIVAQTAVSLLGPYAEQVRMLQERLDQANEQIDDLALRLREARVRVTALEDQVADLTRELDAFRRGERATS